MNSSDRFALGYELRELIKICRYENSDSCDLETDFKLLYDPIAGNCYTFKPPYEGTSLMLRLEVDQADYLPITQRAGVKVLIHPNIWNYSVIPDAGGTNIPAGYSTNLYVKQTIVELASEPYGDCVPVLGYSIDACYRQCWQERVVQECGCGDPKVLWLTDDVQFCQSESSAE